MLQPTVANGWIHQMTCVRELGTRDGRLFQRPVTELQALRSAEQHYGPAADAPVIDAQRLELLLSGQGDIILNFADQLRLEWRADGCASRGAVWQAASGSSVTGAAR